MGAKALVASAGEVLAVHPSAATAADVNMVVRSGFISSFSCVGSVSDDWRSCLGTFLLLTVVLWRLTLLLQATMMLLQENAVGGSKTRSAHTHIPFTPHMENNLLLSMERDFIITSNDSRGGAHRLEQTNNNECLQ